MKTALHIRKTIALLIAVGAVSFVSCGGGKSSGDENLEGIITQQSDTLTIISSKNGEKSYRFETPLMERYELAREPYMEFRHGIKIETYKKDTTQGVESTLVADYAIFFEPQKLWEAKGNVVAVNADGQILETQQLFWNQITQKVYSNIDSKITQGNDVIVGVGFESDEEFKNWEFRSPKGKLEVDVTQDSDSTATQQGTVVEQPSAAPAARPAAQQPARR